MTRLRFSGGFDQEMEPRHLGSYIVNGLPSREPRRGPSDGRGGFATKFFTPAGLPGRVPAMNPPEFMVRRATVDDLGGLKILWERARLQVLDLERHLTEFQLAVSMEGDLLGAAALRVQGKDGLLHSEAFTLPETEEQYRPAIWQRLHNLARNHALVRIWTREGAPFWHQTGFAEVPAEQLKKLPAAFGDPHARWLTLPLREDTAGVLSLEQEFELFQQANRANTDQVMAQARKLKLFANVVAVAVFVLAAALVGVLAFRHFRQSKPVPAATEPR